MTTDVVAQYVDVWNHGVMNAPTTSAFGGPALIVRGGANAFVTEQIIDAIRPRFADADVKVIPDGGHWVHVDYPDSVASMILEFSRAAADRVPAAVNQYEYTSRG